jgi:predicted acyl esterase
MSRFRRFLRALFRWVLVPILTLAVLLVAFRYFFPAAAKSAGNTPATQLLIRALAFRVGAGWAGEGLQIQADQRVPMRDGARLATDLYLPASGGPHPAILVRTPYNKADGRVIGEFFARYGYGVAVQDTRGRFKSEGEFYLCPFRFEANDGIDFAAWVRQKPWCNGKIGAFGVSYLGFTQRAMAAGKPNLASIAPAFISGNFHKGIYKGGAFGQLTFLDWSPSSYGRYGDWAGAKFIKRGFGHLPLIDSDDAALRDIPFYNDRVSHPQRDVNLKNYGVEQRWLEAIPFEFVKASKDWLDYSLKGAGNGWDRRPAVRAYVLGAKVWRDAEDWPPPEARDLRNFLRSGGAARSLAGDSRLTLDAPAGEEPAGSSNLVDVFPDGRAMIVCEGILRARYREGLDKPKLLEPGAVYPFEIELGPTAVSFVPGHRTRLEIISSNAPRYDVNPNTGGEIATATRRTVATQRRLHGPAEPSALILPVAAPLPRPPLRRYSSNK